MLEANGLQLETEGVTSIDLAFNRNAWLQRCLAERPSISILCPVPKRGGFSVSRVSGGSTLKTTLSVHNLPVKLWLRFATSWLAVLIVEFAISFYVLPYGINWFVRLLY